MKQDNGWGSIFALVLLWQPKGYCETCGGISLWRYCVSRWTMVVVAFSFWWCCDKRILWSMGWHFAVALMCVQMNNGCGSILALVLLWQKDYYEACGDISLWRCWLCVQMNNGCGGIFVLVLLRQKDYYDGLVCGGAPCMCGAAATNQITMSCDSIYFIFCLFYDIG